MEYKKYELLPYHLHVIETKKFKTVTVKINLKRPLKKDEIAIRSMLGNVMLESTKTYPSKRYMAIATENLYGLSCNMKNYRSGNYAIMTLSSSFLDEKYTESGMVKKSLQFLMDILCHPNVNHNAFDQKTFDICKQWQKEYIESYNENPKRYANKRLAEVMDPDAPFSYPSCGTIEEVENITPETLYEYYQSVMKSDIVDIFICGDVNGDEIKNFLLSECEIKTMKKPGGDHILQHKKFRKRCKIVKEKRDIAQSLLLFGCKIDHPTEYERKYVLGLYNYLLGAGGDSRLYRTVREQHSLCYSIYSSPSGIENLMKIQAGIDASNYKKATDLIRKEMKKIASGDVTDEEIEKYITVYLASCKEIEDSPYDLISLYSAHEYLKNDTLEEKEREVLKLNKEMLINFAQKVKLDTIYFLEGNGVDETVEP